MDDDVIGIITALRVEASCVSSFRLPYRRMIRLSNGSVIILSGMGDSAARLTATDLIERGVTALVSFGVAGGLDPNLRPGTLVLPELIHSGKITPPDEEELPVYPVALNWLNRLQKLLPDHLSTVGGTLTASPGVLSTEQAKLELGVATGACAVDMESYAIAEVATKADIPFIVIRAITDPVEFSPPAALLGAIQPEGSVKLIQLLTILFRREVSISTLIRLGKEIRAARSSLAAVIRHADKELGSMPHTVTIP